MNNDQEKQNFLQSVKAKVTDKGFNITAEDLERPWGGFFVIDENQASKFAHVYFDEMIADKLRIAGKLSPKILVVEPQKRLSWQYHHRRAEIWNVIKGPVGVITSETDRETPLTTHNSGDTITLKQEERHRLVGLDNWSTLAEIWQHTNIDHPSDEDDIVRLQDDFGR